MPLRNRVTPTSELVADPARGLVYGNRGCLHDEHGRIRRRYNGKRWIACRLRFRGWQRSPLLQPGKFTELFFLDEATAFAAGHRPCALCRREDYVRFLEIVGAEGADAIDARLHEERRGRRRQAVFADLPDGAFVLVDEEPWLVRGDHLLRWTPGPDVLLENACAADVDWNDFVVIDGGLVLSSCGFPDHRRSFVNWALSYLEGIASRPPTYGCFGLHEWAMVYRTPDVRHESTPLRRAPAAIAACRPSGWSPKMASASTSWTLSEGSSSYIAISSMTTWRSESISGYDGRSTMSWSTSEASSR